MEAEVVTSPVVEAVEQAVEKVMETAKEVFEPEVVETIAESGSAGLILAIVAAVLVLLGARGVSFLQRFSRRYFARSSRCALPSRLQCWFGHSSLVQSGMRFSSWVRAALARLRCSAGCAGRLPARASN